MAIQPCKLSRGGNGFRWGPKGHCYTTRDRALKEKGQHDKPLARARWTGKAMQLIHVCETDADMECAVMMVEHDPSSGEIESGLYLKPHVEIFGLDIEIENPRGSKRSGVGPDGTPWSVVMPDHYGYVRSTEGADGDEVDITIGRDFGSNVAFVIDQIDPRRGAFDEHKCFICFDNSHKAVNSYYASFSDGSGPARAGGLTKMTILEFRSWIESGETIARLTKRAKR